MAYWKEKQRIKLQLCVFVFLNSVLYQCLKTNFDPAVNQTALTFQRDSYSFCKLHEHVSFTFTYCLCMKYRLWYIMSMRDIFRVEINISWSLNLILIQFNVQNKYFDHILLYSNFHLTLENIDWSCLFSCVSRKINKISFNLPLSRSSRYPI